MQLTLFSDYSLRVALYLATHPGRLIPVDEVAQAYGISHHHLFKVVQFLVECRVVQAVRGRKGGLMLAVTPEQINIGALVRKAEPHLNLVECFDDATNTCPISPACGLKGTLMRAQRAFFEVLDQQTLADFVPRAPKLIQLWHKPVSRQARKQAGKQDPPPDLPRGRAVKTRLVGDKGG